MSEPTIRLPAMRENCSAALRTEFPVAVGRVVSAERHDFLLRANSPDRPCIAPPLVLAHSKNYVGSAWIGARLR
jgi:hypothetical protein